MPASAARSAMTTVTASPGELLSARQLAPCLPARPSTCLPFCPARLPSRLGQIYLPPHCRHSCQLAVAAPPAGAHHLPFPCALPACLPQDLHRLQRGLRWAVLLFEGQQRLDF